MVTSEGVLLQVGKAGTDETLYQNCGGRAHGRRQSRAKREQKISTSERKTHGKRQRRAERGQTYQHLKTEIQDEI